MKTTKMIPLIGILLALLLLPSLQSPVSATEPTNGRIYGYTFQSVGWMLLPVPFVQITAGAQQTNSNLSGYYELNNLSLGIVYDVSAKKFGFHNTHTEIQLTADQPIAQIDFILSARAEYCLMSIVYYSSTSSSEGSYL